MLTAIDLLRRFWKPAAVLLLLLAVWLHGDHNGDTRRDREWSARWHQHVAEDATLAAAAERQAREEEQKWAALYDATTTQLEKEKDATDQKLAAALARHRAGGLRLPTCPAAPGLPEDPANPPGGTQAATGQLPGQPDQPLGEFLLTEAARADNVALQLAACQAVLRGIR